MTRYIWKTEDIANLYAMKYRPPQFCTLPKGLKWIWARPELQDDRQYPHGVIRTDRALTEQELYDFEIREVRYDIDVVSDEEWAHIEARREHLDRFRDDHEFDDEV